VEALLESLITQLSLSPSLLGEKDIDITYEIADDVPRYLIGVPYHHMLPRLREKLTLP
jgi:hypothetical protein